MNIGFNALEMMVATLAYHEVCGRWVPQMLTQEQKEHCIQVCQDILNQNKAEGDSILDPNINGDKEWCHQYELEWQFME